MDPCRDDLRSILPFLPLWQRSATLCWPPAVLDFLNSITKGPIHSKVDTGHLLALAISDVRDSLQLPYNHYLKLGFSLFFDDLICKGESEKWFSEVMPRLGYLLLKLPELLETHYQNAGICNRMGTGLRILESQEPGIVFMSQELIASLLVCAFLGLFPTTNRGAKHLPTINFDDLFMCLYEGYDAKMENKIKCIIHYFERICLFMPTGNVSFERKVLPLRSSLSGVVYPRANFWSKSTVSLCKLEVHDSGLIEDQPTEALEVDFANKYIGGGALGRGCVQEEIRFMINPELLISMLFFPSMADNEAIEIIGTERFSNYTGYASSFRFSGNYVDRKGIDPLGRRKTRIIAIDALYNPGNRQYKPEFLLREANKALAGFFYQNLLAKTEHSSCERRNRFEEAIGIATGNWGCGAFGGDGEVKAVIQWLAASQALRPFILYYTFGVKELQKMEAVTRWISSNEWTVGELWDMLIQYSTQRAKEETGLGFFNWLIPLLYDDDDDDPMILDDCMTNSL